MSRNDLMEPEVYKDATLSGKKWPFPYRLLRFPPGLLLVCLLGPMLNQSGNYANSEMLWATAEIFPVTVSAFLGTVDSFLGAKMLPGTILAFLRASEPSGPRTRY
jgi:hypothetical protein